MNSARLSGRVAIVTGGCGGLGSAYARLLVKEGALVVVADLGGAPETASAIDPAGTRVSGFNADVSTWEGAESLIAHTVDVFGGLHALINNAGLLRPASSLDLTRDDWDAMISANLTATIRPTHEAIRYWKSQPSTVDRVIIHTTSGSGLTGNPGRAPYGAGKAGAALLTLTQAQELAEIGVRVNAVSPTARTPMTTQTQAVADLMAPPDDGSFDRWSPDNLAPLVGYLAMADCPLTGCVWDVRADRIAQQLPWSLSPSVLNADSTWTIEQIRAGLDTIAQTPERLSDPLRNAVRQTVLGGVPRSQ
jgi:NAD(P)-dependent dehydrogenase (short-subunit alcohol dehydrogenase family)